MVSGMKTSSYALILGLALLGFLAPGQALAHGEGISGGFLAGLGHPLFGWDHVAAMVAVGLWGAFLGSPAIWLLPVVFPLMMALGAIAGIMGAPLPSVEIGIAVSAIVLGAMVLFRARPPLWLAMVLVGIFAVFHGHAHGTELPGAANPMAYAAGFVISTGLLHLAGIAFGLLTRFSWGSGAVRTGGALIGAAGCYFLYAAV